MTREGKRGETGRRLRRKRERGSGKLPGGPLRTTSAGPGPALRLIIHSLIHSFIHSTDTETPCGPLCCIQVQHQTPRTCPPTPHSTAWWQKGRSESRRPRQCDGAGGGVERGAPGERAHWAWRRVVARRVLRQAMDPRTTLSRSERPALQRLNGVQPSSHKCLRKRPVREVGSGAGSCPPSAFH